MWNVNDIRAVNFFSFFWLDSRDSREFWYSSHDPLVVCSRERRNFHLSSVTDTVFPGNWMFTIRFASHPHLTLIIRWKNDSFAWRSKRGFTKRKGWIQWKLKLKEDSRMCESNARQERGRGIKRSSRKRKKEKWRLGKMNYGKWTLRFMLSCGKFNPIRSN